MSMVLRSVEARSSGGLRKQNLLAGGVDFVSMLSEHTPSSSSMVVDAFLRLLSQSIPQRHNGLVLTL
jgi:hypothetical protein